MITKTAVLKVVRVCNLVPLSCGIVDKLKVLENRTLKRIFDVIYEMQRDTGENCVLGTFIIIVH